MYFPSDMNFQYFFFDTYPGYFLQALPVALIAGESMRPVRSGGTGGVLPARLSYLHFLSAISQGSCA